MPYAPQTCSGLQPCPGSKNRTPSSLHLTELQAIPDTAVHTFFWDPFSLGFPALTVLVSCYLSDNVKAAVPEGTISLPSPRCHSPLSRGSLLGPHSPGLCLNRHVHLASLGIFNSPSPDAPLDPSSKLNPPSSLVLGSSTATS